LASTIVTALVGKPGDLFGRKRVFRAAVVFFVVGSVLCGLAQSMAMLWDLGHCSGSVAAGSPSPPAR
jgi:MFS family permease